MLRSRHDWQSLLYLTLQPLLIVWLWQWGSAWTLLNGLIYGLVLFLSVAVGVVHHNHAHLKLWRNEWLNRLTDLWLTLLQGHPTLVLHVAHNGNHHRHHHGPGDVARTYRFGGDTNHLLGYLLHPFQAVWAVYPMFLSWLNRIRHRSPRLFLIVILQYAAVATLWSSLIWLDFRKWLLLVLIPQLHGLHWLLASNYLQHAHADGRSSLNFARNFEGGLNLVLFNIGLHTAHHLHPRTHWSDLPVLHAEYRAAIDPRLNAGGLVPYMFKTFVLSLFLDQYRSRSLMTDQRLMPNNPS